MKTFVLNIKPFHLQYTLECGQCFRWKPVKGEVNTYIGVVKDRVLKIKQDKTQLFITSSKEEGLLELIEDYFDLKTDYMTLENRIAKIDSHLKEAITYTSGLRHLHQEPLETIISYIISSNNNIPRITKAIEEISKRFGSPIVFEGTTYYLFPTLEQLSCVTQEEFRSCGVGFRDRYLVNTIQSLQQKQEMINLSSKLSTQQLRKELLSFQGIGQKVADCILLFSYRKQEVFPIDVWVERVMKLLYFPNQENVKKEDMITYASTHFGKDAGMVQQHLFYNIRNHRIMTIQPEKKSTKRKEVQK